MSKIFMLFFLLAAGTAYGYVNTSIISEDSLKRKKGPTVIYYQTTEELYEALCSGEKAFTPENVLKQSAEAQDWPVHTAKGPGHQGWYIHVAEGPGHQGWYVHVAEGPGHQGWYIYADIRPSGPLAQEDWPVHTAQGPGHQGWYVHVAESSVNARDWPVHLAEGPGQLPWRIRPGQQISGEAFCNRSAVIAGPTALITGPTFM